MAHGVTTLATLKLTKEIKMFLYRMLFYLFMFGVPSVSLAYDVPSSYRFPYMMQDPDTGQAYRASYHYSGNTINYFVEPSAQHFDVEFNGRRYPFSTRDLLEGDSVTQGVLSRWNNVIRLRRTNNMSEANLVIRSSRAPAAGPGAGALAIGTSLGYGTPRASRALIEIHPEQFEPMRQRLETLEQINRYRFIDYEEDYQLLNTLMLYTITHEFGHVLGFSHSRMAHSCIEQSSILNQRQNAPLMIGDLTDYFLVQYHLNNDTAVSIEDIRPSRTELAAYQSANQNGNQFECGTVNRAAGMVLRSEF
ncbi:hypothetical protein [Vibrio paucivorans]